MIATRDEMLKLIADYMDDKGRCDVAMTDWKGFWKRPLPVTCLACWFYSGNNGLDMDCDVFCSRFSAYAWVAPGRNVLIEAIKDGRLAWWEGALRVVED